MKLAVRVALGAPPANYHGCSTQETFWEDAVMKTVARGNKFSEQCKLGDTTVVIEFPLARAEKLGGLRQWEATTPAPKQKNKDNYHGCGSKKPRRHHGKGPARTAKGEKFSQRRIRHEATLENHKMRKRLNK